MLTAVGPRTLSAHAARSTPVLRRAPAALRRLSHVSFLKQSLHARSVGLVLHASAEEATVQEQAADTAADVSDTTTSSSNRDSSQERKQQGGEAANRSSSGRHKDRRMQASTLYVQNLAWTTSGEDLQEAFRGCAEFADAYIVLNKNGRPAGFGFVRFDSPDAAAAAEQAMNGAELDGRPIKVRLTKPDTADATSDATTRGAAGSAAAAGGSGDASYELARKQRQQRRPADGATSRRSSSSSSDTRGQASTLYVQNLAWATLSEDLQEAFSSCAGFEDAFIVTNQGGRHAGYGFVRFESPEAAAAAQQDMDGMELDGRVIGVHLARPGRADAPSDSSAAAPAAAAAAPSAENDKYHAASETETRVVVSNLPAGYTYREVFGMCSLFGEVSKVVMYSKNSSKAVPGAQGDQEEEVEQQEQDAAAGDGDAAEGDEEEHGGSSSGSAAQQQQEGQQGRGGSAVVIMVGRRAAEEVVAELDKRAVQGTTIRANLYRAKKINWRKG